MDSYFFSRVLGLCEKQTASPRICTRVTGSIFHDDNRYSKNASVSCCISMYFNKIERYNVEFQNFAQSPMISPRNTKQAPFSILLIIAFYTHRRYKVSSHTFLFLIFFFFSQYFPIPNRIKTRRMLEYMN